MNKKLFVISGIVLMILLTSLSFPVTSETNDAEFFGRTRLHSIGWNFHICPDDGGLYGHILIGFRGIKPVFNEDIYIPNENIIWIVMTKNILTCLYKE